MRVNSRDVMKGIHITMPKNTDTMTPAEFDALNVLTEIRTKIKLPPNTRYNVAERGLEPLTAVVKFTHTGVEISWISFTLDVFEVVDTPGFYKAIEERLSIIVEDIIKREAQQP